MKYSKNPLTVAILLALSSNVFASDVCVDGVCSTITTQEQLNHVGLNGQTASDITLNFAQSGISGSDPSHGDLDVQGNKNVVTLNGKGTVLSLGNEQKSLQLMSVYGMDSLVIESENTDGKGAIHLVNSNTELLLGRKENTSKGEYLKSLRISSENGPVFHVEAGQSDGTSSQKLDDWALKSDVRIYALNSYLETKNGIAIIADGDSNDIMEGAHSDIEFVDIGDKAQTVTIISPDKAIKATNGGGFMVSAGSVDIQGSIEVDRNAWVELGYDNKYTFPPAWVDNGFETDPQSKVLEKVSIVSDSKTPALNFADGGAFSVAAKTVHLESTSGKAIEIVTSQGEGIEPTVVDVYAQDSLTIVGDIRIDARQGLNQDGYINIRSGDKSVIRGDIEVINNETSGQVINIGLYGENSIFEGSINTRVEPSANAIMLLAEQKEKMQGANVALREGALWKVTGNSNVTNIDADGGVIDAGSQKVEIENLNTGNNGTQFKSNSLTKDQIAVANNTGNGQVAVDVDLTQTQGVPSGDELTKALGGIISYGNNQNATDTKVTGRNNVNDVTVTIDKDGNQKSETSLSGVVESANDITSTQMLAWRAQINDVNKRLGDLRTYEGNVGSWARVFGGKSEFGDRDLDNKYTTVQLGADTKIMDNFYVGMTAHYTDGESTLNNGSSEDQSYGFGVYGGWLADNGQFVDVIVKRTRMDTDFDLYYTNGQKSSGSFDTWGTSVSVEYGWRLNCPSTKFWVEPQVEVSYGHLEGVNYTTSTGNRTQQDSMDSLIGRFGVAVGGTFDMGSAYLKASVAHEFDGESSATVTNGAEVGHATEDLSGTFGEVALGGTMNFTKNFSGYGEFQTTFGSPVKSPYQWNVGVRYTF